MGCDGEMQSRTDPLLAILSLSDKRRRRVVDSTMVDNRLRTVRVAKPANIACGKSPSSFSEQARQNKPTPNTSVLIRHWWRLDEPSNHRPPGQMVGDEIRLSLSEHKQRQCCACQPSSVNPAPSPPSGLCAGSLTFQRERTKIRF